ncbi:MAG: hypothetical protein JSW30_01135 [Dehalococcoidia bacterium]|nr:MAG: hypothetical protein JSW30_01135 [Dehalococcoidia bacterium]
MAEELGKIEKPPVEQFKKGRKLYLVPLIYCGQQSPNDYRKIFSRYWHQAEGQIGELELKLGQIARIYHELIPVSGEDGLKAIKGLNQSSYQIVKDRLGRRAQLEAAEDIEALTEFMDWSRCLALGLQNPRVFARVYESYIEVNKQRNEYIARHIDETLNSDEIGILFIREEHQLQFPSDIEVFYIAPPALDEINRWLREQRLRPSRKTAKTRQGKRSK